MLKQTLLYFCIILIIASCNKYGGPDKPDNLISKSDMVKILIDSKIIGSATSANKIILEKHGVNLETYVYEKYKIDSLQFAQSNSYYAHNIKDYEEIYDKVIDSLERLKVYLNDLKLKLEKEEKKKETDSLDILKAKDSIKRFAIRDSILKIDSLKTQLHLNTKEAPNEGVLVNPVSDRD